ncbi:molybdopterin cofactor-binding domain-containing protein [Sphingomonas sp.]|uniref:molybdopterin cofactor-binding domain-containing protein n=1 Tax=Sphingomonas sp. TaxID=28214 RepID=UPI00286C909C|nr:molybdopterin cofactor-binding domain-containing protein [Sphingomonas sp.]
MKPIDRRTLLISGGVGVGLIVAFAAWPRKIGSALTAAKGERVFGHYLKIAPDGRVTVAVPQAETGQGIWTGLAQVAADELGAAWEQVAVEPAPMGAVYANSLLKRRKTAGATSIRAFEQPLREAGAVARDLLIRAAADHWEVDPALCQATDGFVMQGANRLAFGQLAEAAAGFEPGVPMLRKEGSGQLSGQSLARLDLPAKLDGSLRFASDVRLPDMLFAAVRIAPPGGRLTGYSRNSGEQSRGVRKLLVGDGWLAALGETWWAAERGLVAAGAQFTGKADANDMAIMDALGSALDSGERTSLFARGDYEATVGTARALAATYRISAAEHRSLEPLSATARIISGKLELWAPVQDYDAALAAAARVGGVSAGEVTLYPMPIGDPSGRGMAVDAIPIAVEFARRVGRPVQLTISAKVGRNHDRVRSPMLARMTALPSPAGGLAAWGGRFVTASGTKLPGATPAYAVPSMRIESLAADLPIATSYMRGGSEALTGFANESFIDEMARRLGAEPFSFRMGLLGGNVRLAKVLEAVATLGRWDGGAPGSRLGLAAVSAFGSHIALLAEAGIGPDQRVAVERLVAVVDCGRAINPGLVKQQVEGSLIEALSLATADAPEFVAGMPVARPLRSAGITWVGRVPTIIVELAPSTAAPGGVSGLGHVVLAAAVANALASGTGRRLRDLPFNPMAA